MKRLLFLIALGIAGAILFRKYGFEGIYVASPSMEPTLPVGQHYFVDKFSLLFRSPERGEIVVLDSPVEEDKGLIKRVVGLAGETIEIKEKKVYINGQNLNERYAVYKRKGELLEGDNLAPLKIPDECFFVMGDNRDESKDSATWKDDKTGQPVHFVSKEKIRGRLLNVLE